MAQLPNPQVLFALADDHWRAIGPPLSMVRFNLEKPILNGPPMLTLTFRQFHPYALCLEKWPEETPPDFPKELHGNLRVIMNAREPDGGRYVMAFALARWLNCVISFRPHFGDLPFDRPHPSCEKRWDGDHDKLLAHDFELEMKAIDLFATRTTAPWIPDHTPALPADDADTPLILSEARHV